MILEEKTQLLALFENQGQWSRDAEARNADGAPVTYDDKSAVAWDLTGAVCRLFGWERACTLFAQLERHIIGKRKVIGWPERDTDIESMTALQAFNDRAETTFDKLRECIATMPVWSNGTRVCKTVADG